MREFGYRVRLTCIPLLLPQRSRRKFIPFSMLSFDQRGSYKCKRNTNTLIEDIIIVLIPLIHSNTEIDWRYKCYNTTKRRPFYFQFTIISIGSHNWFINNAFRGVCDLAILFKFYYLHLTWRYKRQSDITFYSETFKVWENQSPTYFLSTSRFVIVTCNQQ